MKDRMLRGFAAGVVAGLVANAVSLVDGWAGLTTLRYIDWTAIGIFGHAPPFTTGELLWAFVAQIWFNGLLGVVFAYLVLLIGSDHLLFRGWMFSGVIWFVIYSVSTMFRIEGIVPLPLKTVISNFLIASIYGVGLGYSLRALTPGEETAGSRLAAALLPQPAAKHWDKDGEEDGE